jgi:hypothetical protein
LSFPNSVIEKGAAIHFFRHCKKYVAIYRIPSLRANEIGAAIHINNKNIIVIENKRLLF